MITPDGPLTTSCARILNPSCTARKHLVPAKRDELSPAREFNFYLYLELTQRIATAIQTAHIVPGDIR